MADDPLPATLIKVVNGDLSFAQYPVLVGHYVGDAIGGSEGQLDSALGGALRRRYALGVYPGAPGTAIVAQHPGHPERRGVVVGLGDMGAFSVVTVRTAVVTGMLELALSGGARGISLVMVGVRAGLIPTAEILAAMLAGIDDAQRRIPTQGLTAFDEIQIIAQMEDSAHLAWHNLKRLAGQPRFAGQFEVYPEVVLSLGARRRIARVADPDAWRAVQVEGTLLPDNTHTLNFGALGGAARAEGFQMPANLSMIRSIIDAAVEGAGDKADNSSPARALFEMVWPNELKHISHEDRNLRLILDSFAASLPFELMDDRQGPLDTPNIKPPAVRHGIVRQLMQTQFARARSTGSTRATALVIGDPRGGPPAADFKPLPNARTEAKAVADMLTKAGFTVTALIGDAVTPVQVVDAVMRGGWTIIHISAHGIFNYRFRSDRDAARESGATAPIAQYTGVVLGDKITLSPSMLQGMSDPPVMAFLNCCNLAAIDPGDEDALRRSGRADFAASFAAQLIALGTSTVIAAGWEVDDAGAVIFAETIYDAMLNAEASFGDAVLEARQRVYDNNPADTTWGAYQCYGEPDWQLRSAGLPHAHETADVDFASHVEALAMLSNLANEAQIGVGRTARAGGMNDDLAAAEIKIRAMNWMDRPYVAEAVGRAHAALGHFDNAIACLEEALASDAKPSLQAVETIANLRIRAAAAAAAAGTKPIPDALAEIVAARARLTALCDAAGATPERLSLIGGSHKREAELTAGDTCDAALAAMRDAYRKAWDLAPDKIGGNAYYPAENLCTANVLLALRQKVAIDPCLDDLANFALAVGLDVHPDDRWRAGSQVSQKLLSRLATDDLTDEAGAAMIAAYRWLWESGGDYLSLDTMLGHLRFVRRVLDDRALADAVHWLQKIEDGVAALPVNKDVQP